MDKQIESNVLMWGIGGDEELDQQAEIIAGVRKKLRDSNDKLEELEEEIEIISNRANTYVASILNMPEYDNSIYMLVVNDENVALVYEMEIFKDLKEIDYEDHINWPDPIKKAQLTSKQALRLAELMTDYNALVLQHEDLSEEYDDLSMYHDEVWENVLESLVESPNFKVFENGTTEDEIEIYDTEKHLLIVIKDEKNKWGFRYIRREDEEEFYKFIEENF